MSVDLVGTMHRPIGLDVLVAAARSNLAKLLSLQNAPPIEVFADRRHEESRRRLPEDELAAELIGEHIAGPLYGRPATCHFEFEITETSDRAWLTVMDFSEEISEPVEAIFSPSRTCVGVVLATTLALAAAEHGRGEFLDHEIRMLELTDPRQIVDRTRMRNEEAGFAARCERYMRQFPQLNGWPRDASMMT